MKANLYLKYTGIDGENSEIDLYTLGKSLTGFDKAIREIIKITKIKGDIEIRATKIKKGSLIIDLLVELSTSIPFESPQDYLDFLYVAGSSAYKEALAYLNQTHTSLNEFYKERPFDAYAISTAIVGLFSLARIQKNKPVTRDESKRQIPAKYAVKLHKMIKNRKFRRALKPFVENEVSAIELSADNKFKKSTQINERNFENYLSEKEEVLPKLANGSVHELSGKIVSLQCSRGESMKFRLNNAPKRYRLLLAYPSNGRATSDFAEYYGKDVWIKSEIVRRSLYQKPKLIIKEIGFVQSKLHS